MTSTANLSTYSAPVGTRIAPDTRTSHCDVVLTYRQDLRHIFIEQLRQTYTLLESNQSAIAADLFLF